MYQPINNTNDLRPGDLVYFKDTLGYVKLEPYMATYYNQWNTVVSFDTMDRDGAFFIQEDEGIVRWLPEEVVGIRRKVYKKTTRLPKL